MSNEYMPQRAMSIHAHPDDQDFTVAGTLAKWAKAGCEIVTVIITDGSAGTNDPQHGPDYKPTLARIRADEQRAANAVLGVKETIFLGYPDGELVASIALRKELTRLIRKFKPDAVVIGDPTAFFYGSGYINHPDHRAAAEAAMYAVFPSAGSRPIFMDLLDEGLELHNVKRLYIHGSEKSDTWVDITETLDTKIEALKKHASQLDTHDVDDWMKKWAESEAEGQEMKYAEAYKVMVLQKDEDEKEGS
ncbi:MAG: PIG-L family deacetylase [Anaerolineales bacterium]|nr:PIG-L family deacetylase [Anaerolineae bacterium]PWB73062.1 MAG: PIG-L family deacetylase [Anaerolineales bacterium]